MQNVRNALRVLEEVAERQPVGVAELARALGLPKSSVQRALLTLHEAGWLRPAAAEGPTRWRITARALHVGRHATGELGLRDAAVPVLERLRARTDETVHLAVPEGERVVLVERLETAQPVRIILPLGQVLPAHASANGKALLAARTDAEVEEYLAAGPERYTGATVTDPAALRAEIAAIRTRGWSANRGEWRADVSAVAAAVLGERGRPVASLSVNVPTSRLTDEACERFGAEVVRAAAEVGGLLGGGS